VISFWGTINPTLRGDHSQIPGNRREFESWNIWIATYSISVLKSWRCGQTEPTTASDRSLWRLVDDMNKPAKKWMNSRADLDLIRCQDETRNNGERCENRILHHIFDMKKYPKNENRNWLCFRTDVFPLTRLTCSQCSVQRYKVGSGELLWKTAKEGGTKEFYHILLKVPCTDPCTLIP
jgi:hypothetical protein